MEDIRCVKDMLSRNDFMCKLDLRDAYPTVPIHPSHWRFLRFHWQGKTERQSSSLHLGDIIQSQFTPLTGGDGHVGMDTIHFVLLLTFLTHE